MGLSRRKHRELIASLYVLFWGAYSTWCMPTGIRPYKQLSLRMVTNVLYPCAVLLSQVLCDVSRIGALVLSSFLARFAHGHIHTALFNCQGTVICGGSYQICRIHYGGNIHITLDNNIPSSSSHWECTKVAMIWRISKNALTYPKEKIGVLTTSNSDLLQFVYRIYPRITLTVAVLFICPLNW